MKKITSLFMIILALFTVLSFASCDRLSTEEVINGAIKNTAKLNEYEAKMNMSIDMSMTNMTMSVPMSISMKVKDADKENPIVWALMSMEMMGQKTEIESYMDNEYAYVLMGDEGYKMSVDDSENEFDYTEDLDDMFKELPVDLIKDIELEKNKDGIYKVTVTIPDEVFEEAYGDLIDSMNETALGMVDGSVSINECVVTVTVKGDYVTNYDISYKMSMSAQGIDVDATVTANMEFVNLGEAVTITPPEGYKNFISSSDLIGSDW